MKAVSFIKLKIEFSFKINFCNKKNVKICYYLSLKRKLFLKIGFSYHKINGMSIKKSQIVFLAHVAGITILAIVFAFSLYGAFFRPKAYIVITDDVIYDTLNLSENSFISEKPLCIAVKKSESTIEKQTFFSPRGIVAAELSYVETLPFLKKDVLSNEKFYELDGFSLVPSVPSNFKNYKFTQDSVVSFSTISEMPEGNQALPVEGLYAGDDDYKLNVTCGVYCTVYEDEVDEVLDSFCKEKFSQKKKLGL